MLRFSIVVLLLVLQLVSLEARSQKWNEFKTRYGKKYDNATEEAKRQAIFESKAQMVEEWNSNHADFKLAVNKHADKTHEEIVATRTGLKSRNSNSGSSSSNNVATTLTTLSASSYPTTLTYVGTSLVSSVEDQGDCGSCWAFSVSGAVEAQSVKAFGKMIAPSEQQLVDCDTLDDGCNGGDFETAYTYMSSGIQNSSTYPYVSGTSGVSYSCSASSSLYVVYTNTSTYSEYSRSSKYTTSAYGQNYGAFVAIPDTSNSNGGDLSATILNQTIAALNDIGPLSIGVCAESDSFDMYSTGIYSASACTLNNIDHAVLLVGYNRSSSVSSQNYWIIKNQWGTDWGLQGYMYMEMGAGLIRQPMYPILKGGSTTAATATTAKASTSSSTTAKANASSSTTAKASTSSSTTAKTTTKSTTKSTTRPRWG